MLHVCSSFGSNLWYNVGKYSIPGTQMTLVLIGKDLVLKGSTTKIEDKQVPGTWSIWGYLFGTARKSAPKIPPSFAPVRLVPGGPEYRTSGFGRCKGPRGIWGAPSTAEKFRGSERFRFLKNPKNGSIHGTGYFYI